MESIMDECEYINKCPFYNNELEGDTDKIEELKKNYCQTSCMHCARYMIATALNSEAVPEDLYPDQKSRAYEIISNS